MTTEDKPKFADAPGIVVRRRGRKWYAEWRARSDLKKRGFLPKSQRLWIGEEPTAANRASVSDMCNQLQASMAVWARGGIPQVGAFDGTLKSLIYCYQTDPDSNYRTRRFCTRNTYDTLCRAIEREHGAEELRAVNARLLLRWHEQWSDGGKVSMAHALVGMLRTLFGFGATFLEDADCERLCGVLHRMKFKNAKPRSERITAEQVTAIRAAARAKGLHSLALAQALQFELMLRQKDVIGEYVPQSEPGLSDVTHEGNKWLRGLRWEEIERTPDGRLILRHTTSKRGKDIEVDLTMAPMVMEELARLDSLPASGPIITAEATGRPWTTADFRHTWRKLATAAGIPASIRNMDSRAGGISEATDAGVELEHVRHAATHSNIATTQGYSRNSVEKTASVMQRRVAYRNKK